MHLAKPLASTTLDPFVSVPCEPGCCSERDASCLALSSAEEGFFTSVFVAARLTQRVAAADVGSGVCRGVGDRARGGFMGRIPWAVACCGAKDAVCSGYGGQRCWRASACGAHPARWGLLLPSPLQRGGGGSATACPATNRPWPLQRRHQPCRGLAGGRCPSLLGAQPSCFPYILSSSKFLPHFFPGSCRCNAALTQDAWPWLGAGTGTRWEVHPKPGSGREVLPRSQALAAKACRFASSPKRAEERGELEI